MSIFAALSTLGIGATATFGWTAAWEIFDADATNISTSAWVLESALDRNAATWQQFGTDAQAGRIPFTPALTALSPGVESFGVISYRLAQGTLRDASAQVTLAGDTTAFNAFEYRATLKPSSSTDNTCNAQTTGTDLTTGWIPFATGAQMPKGFLMAAARMDAPGTAYTVCYGIRVKASATPPATPITVKLKFALSVVPAS